MFEGVERFVTCFIPLGHVLTLLEGALIVISTSAKMVIPLLHSEPFIACGSGHSSAAAKGFSKKVM